MTPERTIDVVLAEPSDWRALREASGFYARRSAEARVRGEDGLATALAGAARFLAAAADEEQAAAIRFEAQRAAGIRAFREQKR